MEPIVSGIEGVGPDAVERAMAAPVAKPRQAGERRAGKPAARRRVRVAEGIYRDRHGLATTVKVNGVQREVRFPPGTPLNTIRAKRDELRASLRTLPAAGRHTLNHDAGRYLDQVESTLVSFGDRRRELLAWLPRFGHMRTLALPAHLPMLNAQLHEWRRVQLHAPPPFRCDRVCGKRLKALLPILVPALERHGHLALDPGVREQLMAVSAATIDRRLAPARAVTAGQRPRRRAGGDRVRGPGSGAHVRRLAV